MGSCGMSYVYLIDVGDRKYTVRTGFAVSQSAVAYSWAVRVIGPDWSRRHRWRGSLAMRRSWAGHKTRLVPRAGHFTPLASGRAVLASGTVCTSGGPIDDQVIL